MMSARRVISLVCCGVVLLICGCGEDAELSESKLNPNWQIRSGAFVEGGTIPERFSCEGADVSPTLSWEEPPSGTKSLALLVDDPDAPGGTFTHWMLYNLPPDLRTLNENIPKQPTVNALQNAKQGKNDFGKVGYGGPCPPHGSTHHYRFRLFALDGQPNLPAESKRSDLFGAIEGHVIAEGRLTGVFSR